MRFEDHARLIPWQDKPAYHALMGRADLMLDTIGFSGFNTAMQAIECGLPIVAREGRFMRGRFGSGILRTLGLDELVAADEKAYVDLAVAVASDRERRGALQRQIEDTREAALIEDVRRQLAAQDWCEARELEALAERALARVASPAVGSAAAVPTWPI